MKERRVANITSIEHIVENIQHKSLSLNIDIREMNNFKVKEINDYKYIVINNYDNYLALKENYVEIFDISKEEFEDNYLFLIAGENQNTIGKEFNKIIEQENILEICLKPNELVKTNAITVLVPIIHL